MRGSAAFSVLVASTLVAAACVNAGEDRILSITATGVVEGVVYFDADGSREPSTPDSPLAGVRVWLIAGGTTDTTAAATSDGDGLYRVTDLPVGSYRLAVDPSTIGDTVEVTHLDTSEFVVGPGDSLSVEVAVSYPTLTAREVRDVATGTRVFVEGVALTDFDLFGDTTLHVADTSGALRATRIARTAVFAGDSVRLRGVRSLRNGQPVLSDVAVFVVGLTSALPPVVDLTTAAAASAETGQLDAALVRVAGAVIVDSSEVSGDAVLAVNDGSGSVEIVLDADVGIDLGRFVLPGAELEALGVLVPTAAGTWILKPRSAADVDLTVPVTATTEVRGLPLGTRVFVDGIALNRRETFGDTTVHLADTAGAIRAVRVARVTLFPGDSVRIAGAVGRRDGQTVIDSAVVFVLGLADEPPPRTVTLAEAESAVGGTLDAALVRVLSVAVADTLTVTVPQMGTIGYLVKVSDASDDTLGVLIDADIGIPLVPPAPGDTLDVTGLLVPAGPEVPVPAGTWVLKPRSLSEIR